MASGQFVTIKLMRTGGETPWGFRLQGGKEFQMPLSVVKITGGSLSDQAGLQINDIIVKIGGAETQIMRHKEAQDAIINSGNYLELYIERGSINTWKPSITPVGDIRPQTQPLANDPQIFTRTSLEKSPQKSSPIGSGHNTSAKPFATQNMPALVHKQYNSPVNLYSEKNIEETLNAHTQVLETGATGINFIKPDAPVNKESAVYQMVHDEEMKKTKGLSTSPDPRNGYQEQVASPSVIKHVVAPVGNPTAAPQDNAGKNICADCERLIVGVFVRINNKSLHAECFRCATCGTSLKNMGYFSINDKLYCDIHARQVKSFLGASDSSTFSAAPPAPVVAPDTNFTNGFQAAQPSPAPIHPIGTGTSVGMQLTPLSNGSAPYQPVASTKISQNEVNSFSTLKKYSPVSPPTAPKPFGSQANRNSMYISNPAPFMSDTNSTGNSKYNWPPSSNAAGNIVTSTFASRTQTTAQTIIPSQPTQMPGANLLPQTNLSSGPNAGRQLTSSTTSTFGKTLVSDSRSAPRRGRGLLQSQLSGGVIPFCGYCSQQIRGQYIMALNKTWCPNHFVCANTLCKRSLEENGFVEEQGRLYCENCYETHFAPSCAKCSQRIKGDCLNALDRQWHPNCFTCSYCKNPFGNSSFYLEDGFPYCEKDWNDLFTTKCVGCGFPIAAGDRWVEALNQNYHSTCFKCTVCHGNLEGQSFFAKGGRPFCKSHAR